MRKSGFWLADTIYSPTTLLFSGELGAGKTTFIQGLAEGWGVEDTVTSPTYALEQRYASPRGPFEHLDLYRMKPGEASALLHTLEAPQGIRCIEWPERVDASHPALDVPQIDISITEKDAGRELRFAFRDALLPSREQVLQWREDVRLPSHIHTHCDAIADLCDTLASQLMLQGHPLRPLLLRRSAELHDLFRFVDFQSGADPAGFTPDPHDQAAWAKWKEHYEGLHHEEAASVFLRAGGYDALAAVVEVHGLVLPAGTARTTIEQKLLYYADKRVQEDRIVPLAERFADFRRRYAKGKQTEKAMQWLMEAESMEKELGLKEGGVPPPKLDARHQHLP